MLLIWLVLIPSVAAFVCKSACEICAMGTNQVSATCALCRDCKSSENRRMMDFTHRKPTLSDQQMEDLKELEKLEFKKVMQEYGLKPEDLIDDNDAREDTRTPNLRQQTDSTPCDIGPFTKSCFITKSPSAEGGMNKSNEGSGADAKFLTGKTKAKTKAKGKDQRYTWLNCSPRGTPRRPRTARPTSTRCPPVTPCKEALKKITQQGQTSSTLSPYAYIVNNGVTLSDSDYDLNDEGCPTQPICSDDIDEEEYEMRVTKRGSVPPPKIITKTWCPEKLFKMLTTSTTTPPCVPCMPFCQLPCVIMPQTPFLPTQETLTEKYTNERSEENNPILPKEEITKTSSVGTTKDFIYFYVGVPKDVKHLRKG